MESWKPLVVAMILVSFILILEVSFRSVGLWWDEAVYLGLAKNIQKGFYSMDSDHAVESFRPPLLPFALSFFPRPLASRLIVFGFGVVSVVLLYALFKRFIGEHSLWASLFFSTNAFFIFFSTKVLSESLFWVLLISSLYSFVRWFEKREKKTSYALGFFCGLMFMTRYLSSIVFVSFALSFIIASHQKKMLSKGLSDIFRVVLAFAATISPWLYLSWINYGNPFASLLVNAKIYLSSITTNASDVLIFFGPQVVFFMEGLIFVYRHEKNINIKYPLLLISAVSLVSFVFMHHKETRYLLSFLPVYSFAASYSFRHIRIPFIKGLFILFAASSLLTGFSIASSDIYAAKPLIEACEYIRYTTPASSVVASQSFPYVYYICERKATALTGEVQTEEYYIREKAMFEGRLSQENIIDIIKRYNVSYIIVYRKEPENPEYVQKYLDESNDLEILRTFGSEENEAVVYRVKR